MCKERERSMIEIIECLLLFRKLLIAKALFQTILFKMTSGTTHEHVRIFQNKNMKLPIFLGLLLLLLRLISR